MFKASEFVVKYPPTDCVPVLEALTDEVIDSAAMNTRIARPRK